VVVIGAFLLEEGIEITEFDKTLLGKVVSDIMRQSGMEKIKQRGDDHGHTLPVPPNPFASGCVYK
jgi:hypothetical protein